jgi:hypothetical protein
VAAGSSVGPAAGGTPTCPAPPSAGRDFLFRTTPALSRPGGFVLGANSIGGPQCHLLGLDGDGALTVFMLFQPAGAPPAAGVQATAFQLFANTPGGNGLSLAVSDKSRLSLQVGSAPPVACADPAAPFDPQRRYLLAASKDRGGAYRVTLVDVDAKGFVAQKLLSGTVQRSERVPLANVDMTVNGEGQWNASLVALGLVNRALGDADLAALYDHYSRALQEYDPQFQALQALAASAATARSCPFDAATCGACSAVQDWSAASGAPFSTGGSAACLTAIDGYCRAHPTESRCACWDSSNPEYAKACATYRALFANGGAPPPPPPPPAQAQAQAQACDKKPDGELSPASIDAITRLIQAAVVPVVSSCGRCGRPVDPKHGPHVCEKTPQNPKNACDKCGKPIEHGEEHKCEEKKQEAKRGFWDWLLN